MKVTRQLHVEWCGCMWVRTSKLASFILSFFFALFIFLHAYDSFEKIYKILKSEDKNRLPGGATRWQWNANGAWQSFSFFVSFPRSIRPQVQYNTPYYLAVLELTMRVSSPILEVDTRKKLLAMCWKIIESSTRVSIYLWIQNSQFSRLLISFKFQTSNYKIVSHSHSSDAETFSIFKFL